MIRSGSRAIAAGSIVVVSVVLAIVLVIVLVIVLAIVLAIVLGIERAVAADYQIETIAEGLDHPWSIAWLPDSKVLVTERPGRLRMIRESRLLERPIDGVPEVYAASQGGLFEVLPDPEFEVNRWIYLSFAYGTPRTNATRVVRARLEGTALDDGTIDELERRLREIRTGPEGAVWVLTDANPGKVLRLTPREPAGD